MSLDVLDEVARKAGGRIIGALAARFRDLDIAEDAFADACTKAVEMWPPSGVPVEPAAWLYRTAERKAFDALRRRRTRERLAPNPPPPEPSPEETMLDDSHLIPDERLRLIFICCHPAVAPDSRAALTLRLVCGLSVAEIAHAFLVAEATVSQRILRAKRKIATAGIPFEVPRPEAWNDRLDAVLTTIEIAYSKSHEDAAGIGAHAAYAKEVLDLTRALTEMLPSEPAALALAALVRYTEARRPARINARGLMVPLSEQDPALWNKSLIKEADTYLKRSWTSNFPSPRTLQAAIHATWCWRKSLNEPAPWPQILSLYDSLRTQRDDAIVRLNRIVALAEVQGIEAALEEMDVLDSRLMQDFLPFHAVRADLFHRANRLPDARKAYDAALSLCPPGAEWNWLEQRRNRLT